MNVLRADRPVQDCLRVHDHHRDSIVPADIAYHGHVYLILQAKRGDLILNIFEYLLRAARQAVRIAGYQDH